MYMWNKRPTDVSNNTVIAVPNRSSKPPIRRVSRIESKRDSAWARPLFDDVYQNLEDFFPNHDIDRPINEAGEESIAPVNLSKRKTIRMVAEERHQVDRRSDPARMRRRNTKLWTGHIEEVTPHRIGQM
jgi:hypothetical protein